MNKKTLKLLGAVLFVAVAAFPVTFVVRLVIWESRAQSQLPPPAAVKTIQDFDVWRGDEARYFLRHDQSGPGVVARVNFHTGERLASGPASYIFDSTGKLVDWTIDEGDDTRFQKRWPFTATDAASELSRESAINTLPRR